MQENLPVSPSQRSLQRVERARRRTIRVGLFWPGTIMEYAIVLGSLAGAAYVITKEPGALLRPFGGLTLLLMVGIVFTGFIIAVVLNSLHVNNAFDKFFDVDNEQNALSAHPGNQFGFSNDTLNSIVSTIFFFWSVLIPIALVPLISRSLGEYISLTLAGVVLYWLPMFNGFDNGRLYYLYRPTPYIDMYDDPRSRHWVVRPHLAKESRPPVTAAPPAGPAVEVAS